MGCEPVTRTELACAHKTSFLGSKPMLRRRLDHFTFIHLQEKCVIDMMAKYAINDTDVNQARGLFARHNLIANSDSIDALCHPIRHQHCRTPYNTSCFRCWWWTLRRKQLRGPR